MRCLTLSLKPRRPSDGDEWRARRGWLLINALHQRGRPTQRRRPARLLKRNEFNVPDELTGFAFRFFQLHSTPFVTS